MLHIHTVYSVRDGLIKINDLINKAKEYDYKWLSITDHATLAGTLDFYLACKNNNIKPLLGCEFYVENPIKLTNNPQERLHLVLIAKTIKGWKNLLSLLKIASENFYYVNLLPFDQLEKYSDDLICTTACIFGLPAFYILNNNISLGEDMLNKLKNIYNDNLFIELQPNSLIEQININYQLYMLAKKYKIKPVIGLDAHYINSDDFIAHNALTGIRRNLTYKELEETLKDKNIQPDYFLYSQDELKNKFIKNNYENMLSKGLNAEDIFYELINNTNNLPNLVDEFSIIPDKKTVSVSINIDKNSDFDSFYEKHGEKDKHINYNYLRYLTYIGYKNKKIDAKKNKNDYIDRIKIELNDIYQASIYDYMLIIYDMINYCKINNIPYSCGRGSACGSLVAYLLDLHTIDPIQYGLLWERFYNAGRKDSMPDFDFDVASSYRDQVIHYLSKRYGISKVAHISNYVFSKAKMTVKSVCRYFDIPFSQINSAIKNGDDNEQDNGELTEDPINEILNSKSVQSLISRHEKKDEIIKCCEALYNTVNSTSYHASGILITNSDIHDIIPLVKCYDNTLDYASEWDMKMLDKIGAMKIDVLGVKTIDVIAKTIDMVNDINLTYQSWKYMTPNDPNTLKTFLKADTGGVFQFDYGTELKRLLKKVEVNKFDDICILTALGRPGAKMFLDDYVSCHDIELLHHSLIDILKETNNVMAYQEQLMLIASKIANFSLKEADELRKVVAKKQVDKIEIMRDKFIKGAIDNGLSHDLAQKIWDTYFSSCSYLFNKSHAVAYSYVSYFTAYLKTYYPIEYMVSCINVYYDNDNLKYYIYELLKNRVNILLTSLYSLNFDTIYDDKTKTVTLGLNCIKGCGYKTYETLKKILDNTTCRDNVELTRKIALINEKTLLTLIKLGVLDELTINGNRKQLYELMMEYKKLTKGNSKKAQMYIGINPYSLAKDTDDWTKDELIKHELDTLSISLTFFKKPSIKYLKSITVTDPNIIPHDSYATLLVKFVDYDVKQISKDNKTKNIIKYILETVFTNDIIYAHSNHNTTDTLLLNKDNYYLIRIYKRDKDGYSNYYTVNIVNVNEEIINDDINSLRKKLI